MTQTRFSCRYGYLRCHVVRGLRVLSGLALATPLQPPVPSEGGSVTPGSRPCLHGGLRNLDRIPIRFPSRVSVRPRLTLIRLALFRNPWAFGARVSLARCRYSCLHFLRNPWAFGARVSLARCRYSCLHFLFTPLQHTSRYTFSAGVNAPLPIDSRQSQVFGAVLDARSSSTRHRSTSELLRTL